MIKLDRHFTTAELIIDLYKALYESFHIWMKRGVLCNSKNSFLATYFYQGSFISVNIQLWILNCSCRVY